MEVACFAQQKGKRGKKGTGMYSSPKREMKNSGLKKQWGQNGKGSNEVLGGYVGKKRKNKLLIQVIRGNRQFG